MSRDISGCRNANCEEYQDNNCRRAIRHKQAIDDREPMVAYIGLRNNTKACELYLKKDSK